MSTLTCIENYIDKDKNFYGCFLIEPLETGQGITLGNALRRTLLSDLTSFSVTGARINNLKHEFDAIDGLREDPLEILLNLKEIIFKSSFSPKEKNLPETKMKGFLHVKGPIIVTAGMFKLPKGLLKIIHLTHYICTIVDESELYLEIDIEKGKGYLLIDDSRTKTLDQRLEQGKGSTLLVDALFMPIKRVNYKIKLIHDTQGNIKESLNLEIVTDGSITPKRSLYEAVKILMNLFYPLLINSNFLKLSSYLNKKKTIQNEVTKKEN